ncbi:two-component system response regulator TorR [Pelagibius sp. Alg239-R121]|uniref:two-component system response regulator TorR n=1 Tax=Pelagibius sp. Alg239-R121 TaxID=2993448 RepID=UPI0024A662D2|nr:two-component system response regulator TorR [Pelagibius sp. Alg239-R121]
MPDVQHIIVVEDDEVTRAKLSAYLETAGHRVSEAADGQALRDIMERDIADLILLDINLPGEDGLDITRQLRTRSNVGIILLTGRTSDVDRVLGLEIGADDYVTKPFNPRELLARVKALLRRVNQGAIQDLPVKRFSGHLFDLRTRRLRKKNGEAVPLTRAEFELLSAFVAWPGTVLSRDRLLNQITHRLPEPNDRTIDVLVRRLRRKLEVDPKVPEMIVTVHGEGYIFSAEFEMY